MKTFQLLEAFESPNIYALLVLASPLIQDPCGPTRVAHTHAFMWQQHEDELSLDDLEEYEHNDEQVMDHEDDQENEEEEIEGWLTFGSAMLDTYRMLRNLVDLDVMM